MAIKDWKKVDENVGVILWQKTVSPKNFTRILLNKPNKYSSSFRLIISKRLGGSTVDKFFSNKDDAMKYILSYMKRY